MYSMKKRFTQQIRLLNLLSGPNHLHQILLRHSFLQGSTRDLTRAWGISGRADHTFENSGVSGKKVIKHNTEFRRSTAQNEPMAFNWTPLNFCRIISAYSYTEDRLA